MSRKVDFIRMTLPPEEILCQLAEEAAELSQAALKLRRSINGVNPTPKPVEECWKDFLEEVADVCICLDMLGVLDEPANSEIETIVKSKLTRWAGRLGYCHCRERRASHE